MKRENFLKAGVAAAVATQVPIPSPAIGGRPEVSALRGLVIEDAMLVDDSTAIMITKTQVLSQKMLEEAWESMNTFLDHEGNRVLVRPPRV